jgi:transcriptional regulator with XRE-family HTH domain
MSKLQFQATEALKKLLKAKGIIYQDLAERMNLSLPTVKRILSKGDMTLNRLEEICQASEIAVTDVLRLIGTLSEGEPEELTEEQEKILSRYPARFAYFELLLNGMKPNQIENEFGISSKQTIKILSDLDKWGLIEWSGNNKIKLKTSEMIRIRRDGALRKLFKEKCITDFLNDPFEGSMEFQEFRTLRVSETTLRKFNHRLKELLVEFGKEADIENQADLQVKSIATFVAIRKWRTADAFGLI